MSLKYTGSIDGSFSLWSGGETDASTIGTVTADAGNDFDDDNFYRVASSVSNQVAYVSRSVTSGGYGAFTLRFKFRISSASLSGTSKVCRFVQLDGQSSFTKIFEIGLASTSGSANITALNIQHRNASGIQDAGVISLPATITANAINVMKIQYRKTRIANDGILIVSVDLGNTGTYTTVYSSTTMDWDSGYTPTTLKFGVTTCTNASARNIDVADFRMATNSDFTSTTSTYIVDPNHGSASDVNDGTDASLPWATSGMANYALQAGDSLTLVGTKTAPFRTQSAGTITPQNSGTATARITIGPASGEKPVIIGSVSYPPASWTATGVNGEYKVDISGTASDDPHAIWVCTEADWQLYGVDAIHPMIYGLSAVRARFDEHTAGSLAAGTAVYAAGYVYYKPAANETFADLHIEIPGTYTTYYENIRLISSYITVRNLDLYFAHHYNLLQTAGSGNYVLDCNAYGGGQCNFKASMSSGSLHIRRAELAYTIDHGSDSGDNLLVDNGGTVTISKSRLMYSANDGLALNCSTQDVTSTGNLYLGNGHSAEGDQFGIEMTQSGANTAVLKSYFDTFVGNYNGGVFFQSEFNTGTEVKGAVFAHMPYGMKFNNTDMTSHADDLASGNAYWNMHTAPCRDTLGAGDFNPSDYISADPEFADSTIDTTNNALVYTRHENFYNLTSTSPCREQADEDVLVTRYWTTGSRPSGYDGPIPDVRACMGAVQKSRSAV